MKKPFDKNMHNEEGPPYGVSEDEIIALTKGNFNILENSFSALSINKRAGREKLMILEKI